MIQFWLLKLVSGLFMLRLSGCQEMETNNVIEITSDNFDIRMFHNTPFLVFFGTTTCPFCMKFLPTWKYLADVALESNIKTGAVNCLTDQSVCDYFETTKYPYIVYIANGHYYEFEGIRSVENLKKFYENEYINAPKLKIERERRGTGIEWPSVNAKMLHWFHPSTILLGITPPILILISLVDLIFRSKTRSKVKLD